jgi:hypothetical protein
MRIYHCNSFVGNPYPDRCAMKATHFYVIDDIALCRCDEHSFPVLDRDALSAVEVSLDEYVVHTVMSA